MPNFVCDKCDSEFTRKESLEYHKAHNTCKDKDYSCKVCNKQFSAKSSMYRHMRTSCAVKKQQDADKEEIIDRLVKLESSHKQLEEENLKLKKEVKTLKRSGGQKTINKIGTINNNTVNNTNKGVVINNNITLVGYGKEDLTKQNKAELLKILQHGYHSTIKLTEAVHFNPKFPEYHNVFISNMKDKYAMMFDGDDWALTTKEDLITKIYDDKKNYIEENLDEFVDSLLPSRKKALERWLETDDEDAKIKEIKDNIKLLLYNRRKMITVDDTKIVPKTMPRVVSRSKSVKAVKDADDD
ncbi:hypothetical protein YASMINEVIRUS_19 [Yasminevirus sp. GU-2018]|uniref:C2H2-type domain-containing protein n=1 Tax=Yasminevirus sp. GU-2018 TaxID=2420051 RepID=A0A5K0U761_9VIRU|nr:hypothetical protein YASMINEVIRUS_19 [Yasminevirus sp. GU-2018]